MLLSSEQIISFQMVNYLVLHQFAYDRSNTYWTVVIKYIFGTFFMNGGYTCLQSL